MKIYTKTGDRGTTSLVGGARVPKNAPRVEAYGTVDELTSVTAHLYDMIPREIRFEIYRADLLIVLDHLMRLGGRLANEDPASAKGPEITQAQVTFLENTIDRMQAELPPAHYFTLPIGHPLVSFANIARTVCRRAERRMVTLAEQSTVESLLIEYINRLSDLFYVLGRRLAEELGAKEIPWK